jgi:hypothetical protein
MIWGQRVNTAETLRSKRHILDSKMLRSTDSDDGNDRGVGSMKKIDEDDAPLDDNPLEKVKIFLKNNAGFDAIEEEKHEKKRKGKKGLKQAKAAKTDAKPGAGGPLIINFRGTNAFGSAFGTNA